MGLARRTLLATLSLSPTYIAIDALFRTLMRATHVIETIPDDRYGFMQTLVVA